jgi:hypothetical protein
MGSRKCRIVGKSQSVLILININISNGSHPNSLACRLWIAMAEQLHMLEARLQAAVPGGGVNGSVVSKLLLPVEATEVTGAQFTAVGTPPDCTSFSTLCAILCTLSCVCFGLIFVDSTRSGAENHSSLYLAAHHHIYRRYIATPRS